MTNIFIIVLFAWIANLVFLSHLGSDARGTFGDQFGAVNALFSGLAFGGVIFAIRLQRYELQIAREDLRRTKEILDNQNKSLNQQNFEATFFNLLSLLNQIVINMDIIKFEKPEENKNQLLKSRNPRETIAKGKDVFVHFENYFLDKLLDENEYCSREVQERFSVGTREHFKKPERKGDKFFDPLYNIDYIHYTYFRLYQKYRSDLGHYFRTLYNILLYIKENAPAEKQRFYGNLVRAQLSDSEVTILFYNSNSRYGREKMKPLVEFFSLLKNLRFDRIYSLDYALDFDRSAFGDKPTYFNKDSLCKNSNYDQEIWFNSGHPEAYLFYGEDFSAKV